MLVIPVLDLMGGVVVRARFGERTAYRPIVTPLADGAAPVAVAEGLRTLFPFPIVYVADLDGIMRGRPDAAAVDRLAAAFPDVAFWVDNGIADPQAAAAFLTGRQRIRLVLGSETQASPALVRSLGAAAVLSLDYRGDAFQGPAGLLAEPDSWPPDVIAMTLERVGSGGGPDMPRLASIKAAAGPGRRVYAAGGVRDAGDLDALAAAGIAGALVATALHDGRIGPDALRRSAGLA